MFNLSQHSVGENNSIQLLQSELSAFDIKKTKGGSYEIRVGDDNSRVRSLDEAANLINEAVEELKESLWENWNNLRDVAEIIVNNEHSNNGGLDNLLFLSNVKKSYLLSSIFTDLEEVNKSIQGLFNIDVANVSDHLISTYNLTYLKVKLIHRLVMREMYRLKLISHVKTMQKSAQSVSGPWANLDLPMKERVWEWDDGEEEYFSLRQKARREQVRYNPEYTKDGFFYVWQDLTRDPYKFEGQNSDSPYKSRHMLQIP